MKTFIDFKLLFIAVILFCNYSFSQTVNNQSELNTAISNATAGSTITLANGTWSNLKININKTGTSDNPITIKPETVGQVFIEGNSNISLGGQYIVFEGFVFQNASNLVSSSDRIEPIIEFRDTSNNECKNCTVTNIKIDSYNGTAAQETDIFKWIIIYGEYNEVSHSSFIGKNGVGSIINDNHNNSTPDYSKIHHNYFADRVPVDNDVNGLNDQDAIRIGTSSTSLSDSFTEVYDNFFYNWAGEIEIISNKSGSNKYYNNTFRDFQGTLTLRHGNNVEVFGNYFFGNENSFSGGVRVIGEDHKVYNNYFEGLRYRKPSGSGSSATGALNVMNGLVNSPLSGYYQVKNAQIINNTLVNCDIGIRVGTSLSGATLAPENIIVANNIILDSDINAFEILTPAIGTSSYEGNITQNGSWDLTNGTNNNQTVTSGLLQSGTDFYRINSGSPAINSGVGSYSFLTNDILGGARTSSFDAGAEEFAANGTKLPYKVTDVGTKIGFLSGGLNRLSTSVNAVDFNISGGTSSFVISSNVSWTITESVDWLSLNTVSGSNNSTIEITALQNNTGVARTVNIVVSEDGGSLTTTVVVNQSIETFNPSDAVSIGGLTVTGVGTQDPNIPENTIDNDASTRWSANSNDGSAYLTYDLQCERAVTSVKIYFHKGDQRTSSFKIATSDDGTTFTDVTAVLTSSGTTVGFEDFPLPTNTETRYVRILGYGNSEGSGWNSYEEVQIFGDSNCASLNVKNPPLKDLGILMYPIPTNNGFLNLRSQQEIIGDIEIFNIQGKSLKVERIDNLSTAIDVRNLSSGVYFIKIKNTVARFIIN